MNNKMKKENAPLEALCNLYRLQLKVGFDKLPLDVVSAIGALEYSVGSELVTKYKNKFKIGV